MNIKHVKLLFAVFFCIIGLSNICRSEIDPGVIENARKATGILVRLPMTSVATVFCVDPNGLFIVSGYKIYGTSIESAFAIYPKEQYVYLNPGEADEKRLHVNAIWIDPETYIGLISVDTDQPLPFIPMGKGSSIAKGIEVASTGLPIPSDFRLDPKKIPQIVASSGSVINLYGKKGTNTPLASGDTMRFFRVDAKGYDGFIGAPAINSKGELAGMNLGPGSIDPSFDSVSVDVVRQMLSKPHFSMMPNEFPIDKAHSPQEITLKVTDPASISNLTLEMSIGIDGLGWKSFPAKPVGKDAYRIVVTPIWGSRPKDEKKYMINLRNGPAILLNADSYIKDRKISIGGQMYKLSDLGGLGCDEQGIISATLRSRDSRGLPVKVSGKVKGLESVPVKIGTLFAGYKTMNMDLSKIRSMYAVDFPSDVDALPFKIIAKKGTKVVAEYPGSLIFERNIYGRGASW